MNEALLVLAPHPDDEILGAGAIMARAHLRGDRIGVVVLTDGARSSPQMSPGQLRDLRAAECLSGLEAMLGEVPQLLMLAYRDGELDSRRPDLTETSMLGQFLRRIDAATTSLPIRAMDIATTRPRLVWRAGSWPRDWRSGLWWCRSVSGSTITFRGKGSKPCL